MEIDIRLLAPTATSIGIAVSIGLWILNQRSKHLTLAQLTNESLINVRGNARPRVSVKFDGQAVDNVSLVVLKLANTGGLPVVPGDFQTALSLRLNSDAMILSLDIVDSDPVDLIDRFKSQQSKELVVRTSEHEIAIQPVLLNPKDSLTIQMLIQDFHGIANTGCHIHGLKRIETKPRTSILPGVLTQLGAFIMAAAMLFVQPESLLSFDIQHILPFFLLFMVGYVSLWSGLVIPKRKSLSIQ
jgi:hypothetical protein